MNGTGVDLSGLFHGTMGDYALKAEQTLREQEAQKWREIGHEIALGFAKGLMECFCMFYEKMHETDE